MKLHELLAVSKDQRGQAEKVRTDLRNLFEKKQDHFREAMTVYRPDEEGAEPTVEKSLSLQTTVHDELNWFSRIYGKMVDTEYQIACANQAAIGTLRLSNREPMNIPATALLDLEKRLGELLSLVKHLPTLDPTKGFTRDADRGDHVYKAREITRLRTAKVQKPLVLYPATEQHPAQTQLITEDEVVGKLTIQEWSGMLTPAEKAAMLERIETLRGEVKKARSRANEVEIIEEQKIAETLMDYILGR